MLLLLALPAHAWESDRLPFRLTDSFTLIEPIEYDSGYVPSGSPIAVRFQIEAGGEAANELEGSSVLSWPESLTHSYEPVAGSGLLELAADVDIAADMLIDWSGVYYEIPLSAEAMHFEHEVSYDPFALDEAVSAGGAGDTAELFNIEYDVITGLAATLAVEMTPTFEGTYSSLQFTTDGEVIDSEGGSERFDVPDDGLLQLQMVLTGLYTGTLQLVLTPTIGTCIDGYGCYDIASFDLPIELGSVETERDFDPVDFAHPLPVLGLDVDSCDFGDVLVGQIAHCELRLDSEGQAPIEGELGILGEGQFSVFPGETYAAEGGYDGITVTFAPTYEGEQQATLLLTTNDAVEPDREIALLGNGYAVVEDPASDETLDGNETIPAEVGCGCASGPSPAGLACLVPLALAGVRRRA